MEEMALQLGSPVPPRPKIRANFSTVSLEAVMQLLGQKDFIPWEINEPSRLPSAYLREALPRLDAFNLTTSEAAKLVLIDALLVETVSLFPNLRVWKGAPLESEVLVGIADYLIAPKRAYLSRPFLCAVEAKKDDFEQGEAQCVGEMSACQSVNQQEKQNIAVYGIVSNGQAWQFYRLNPSATVERSGAYTMQFLPELLGALYYVCAECAKNAP